MLLKGRDRIAAGLVVLALAVSIFAIGGAPRWAQATVAAISALAVLSLLTLVWVSLRLSVSERGRYALTSAVAGLAGIAALVTGIHVLFGASSLYGIYTPYQASPPILGPLLNSNHLGGLMAVGTVTSIGLFLHP